MRKLTGPSSPKQRPDALGLVLCGLATTVVAALALAPLVAPRLDCARTPVAAGAETRGASLQQVRRTVASDHGAPPERVVTVRDGPDARQMRVVDTWGRTRETVRVVRAADGAGWVLTTANTCDD